MKATRHFEKRAAQRGLRSEVFWFVMQHGIEVFGAGARFVTLAERYLPPGLSPSLLERSRGWVLVLTESGDLLTCYRRDGAMNHVRCKARSGRKSHPMAA